MPTLTPLDVFRTILPQLPLAGLEALALALEADDPALIEDQTVEPLVWPTKLTRDRPPCRGACLVAYPLWKGEELETADEVEDAFNDVTHAVNVQLRDRAQRVRPAAILTDWWDDPCLSRTKKRRMVLPLVRAEIERREVCHVRETV